MRPAPSHLAPLQWFRGVDSHHDDEAYETSWVLNLPGFLKLVDRHGFAPCSPACKAGDLLNDRAARNQMSGSRRASAPRKQPRTRPAFSPSQSVVMIFAFGASSATNAH